MREMNQRINIVAMAGASALVAACSLNPFGEDPTFQEEDRSSTTSGDFGDPTAPDEQPAFPMGPEAAFPNEPQPSALDPSGMVEPGAAPGPMEVTPPAAGPTGAAGPTTMEPSFGGGFDDDALHEEPSADAGAPSEQFADAGAVAPPVYDAGGPTGGDAAD